MLEFLLVVKLFTGTGDGVAPARVDTFKVPSFQECLAKEEELFKTSIPVGMRIRIMTCEPVK